MITKRTHNASVIRQKVVSYILQACKTKDFGSVHVTEICKASDISKVTFFKYFDRKEDVLMLYQSILNTSICIEVSEQDLHSIAGLELIVERFAGVIRQSPSIARELLSAILHSKRPILPVLLTETDKSIFFPGTKFNQINHLSFHDLVEGFMLEGILSKAITTITNPADLTLMFMANLYGALITAHIRGAGQEAVIFNNICRNWLKCLHN